MRIRFKSNQKIQLAIIVYLFIMGFFSGYIEHKTMWCLMNIFLLIVMVIGSKLFVSAMRKENKIFFLYVVVLFLLVIFNIIIFGYASDAIKNVILLLGATSIVIMISFMSNDKQQSFYELLPQFGTFINLMGIINLLVLTGQIAIHGFLIKDRWLRESSYYEDLCAGLFGFNATHELTYYCLFWIIYLLFDIRFLTDSIKKKKLKIFFLVVIVVWQLFLSTLNDNMAIFALLILFVGTYYILIVQWSNRNFFKRLKKYWKYFIISVPIVLVLMSFPHIRDFVSVQIWNRLLDIFNARDSTALGSAERLAIIRVVLSEGYGWKLGIGLGKYDWTGTGGSFILGFKHFGMNSSSSFIALGGLWFYLCYTAFVSWLLWMPSKKRSDYFYFIIIFLVYIISSIYTAIYTSYVTQFWCSLIIVVFSMTKKKIEEK